MHSLRQLIQDDEGATAIEYGLLASMIAVFLIPAVWAFSGSATAMWNSIASHMVN